MGEIKKNEAEARREMRIATGSRLRRRQGRMGPGRTDEELCRRLQQGRRSSRVAALRGRQSRLHDRQARRSLCRSGDRADAAIHPQTHDGLSAMQQNRVKKILREGGLALGTHVGGIPDPQIVELIGLAGFDAAFIDMEHTTFDLHNVQAMVMASERIGVTPIVRTPGFDPAFILRLLDMGVRGVQVPHVSSAPVAREAVKAVRYPPEGERGMAAGSRAANFGNTPLLEHMAQSNREVLLACMIEDMEAVEQIEEIAAVGVTP